MNIAGYLNASFSRREYAEIIDSDIRFERNPRGIVELGISRNEEIFSVAFEPDSFNLGFAQEVTH